MSTYVGGHVTDIAIPLCCDLSVEFVQIAIVLGIFCSPANQFVKDNLEIGDPIVTGRDSIISQIFVL